MISASCPSCGAPIEFTHAASASVVCGNCRSTVVNTGTDELVIAGKLSAFSRDLSPLKLGTTGKWGGRRFTIIGGLRMVRPQVRWNEWYLRLEGGKAGQAEVGWLGEGHGFYQMFSEPPQTVDVRLRRLRPGKRINIGDERWHVMEAAEAAVGAAEGELPFRVVQDLPRRYADLRSVDGKKVGTLSAEDDGSVTLWVGRIVGLEALELEGVRAFGGWSDPVIRAFEGPEVDATRKLDCPNCGASLTLRVPAQSVRMACEYCESELDLQEVGDETTARVLHARGKRRFKPTLEPGLRGTLDRIPWQIVGAMRRAVRFEGLDYPWVEYFLFNPYRGVAFLIEDDNGHWLFVRRCPDQPEDGAGMTMKYRGNRYKHFTDGRARVQCVLGEFGWQVRVQDARRAAGLNRSVVRAVVVKPDPGLRPELVWIYGESGPPISWYAHTTYFSPDTLLA